MNDVIDAVSTRIKSPYFGYAFLSFIALNWRGIFVLFTLEDTPQARLQAFDHSTNTFTLLILPFVIAAMAVLVTPWIKYLFSYVSRRPFELLENFHLETEHKKEILRTRYERSRAELFALKEQELIDQAKRNMEIDEIGDSETKQRLTEEIEQLRKERAQLDNDVAKFKASHWSPAAAEILEAAVTVRNGKVIVRKTLNDRSIQVGNITFGSDDNKSFAEYESALDELISQHLIKVKTSNTAGGYVSELTSKGWAAAEDLVKRQDAF